MSKHHEQATQLLQKADQDTLVLTKLGTDPDIASEILGFHAQQAAEKMLKAVLAELQVTFPYTHRLSDLIDLLQDQGHPIPAALDEIRYLTPFAVQFRYDFYQHLQGDPFDVPATSAMLAQLRGWAVAMIDHNESNFRS